MAGELAAEWIKIPDGNGNLQKVWVRDSTARRDIAQLQTDVSGKADAATTLAGYGITDAYTKTQVDGMIPSVPSAYTSNPEMDGTASPGSSTAWARGDHVHPSDTAKQDALSSVQLAAVNSGITAEMVATILPVMGKFTGDINSTNLTPGIYNSEPIIITLNGASTSVYGAFIQFPGTYKAQLIIGGPTGAGGIHARRYLTGSSSWTAWT